MDRDHRPAKRSFLGARFSDAWRVRASSASSLGLYRWLTQEYDLPPSDLHPVRKFPVMNSTACLAHLRDVVTFGSPVMNSTACPAHLRDVVTFGSPAMSSTACRHTYAMSLRSIPRDEQHGLPIYLRDVVTFNPPR